MRWNLSASSGLPVARAGRVGGNAQADHIDANIVLAGIAPGGGGGGTLYRSTDGGASWVEVAALSGTTVYDIEFTPSGVVYLGTYQGVWKSTDGGVFWTQLNLGIGEYDGTHEVTIAPNNENTIYAGVADHLGNQDQNVLRSTDAGSTWTDITPPMAAPMTCRGIAINPNNSDNIFAAFGVVDSLCYLQKQLVASVMTVSIVNSFETIQIHEEYGKVALLPDGFMNRLLKTVV